MEEENEAQKKNLSVPLPTKNPPQSQKTKVCPTKGITLRREVITTAAQNLIWPQTNVYPKKAVAINPKKSTSPDNQTLLNRYLCINKALKIWEYKRINIKEAPLKWISRSIHPLWTSNIIYWTLLKGVPLS